MKRKTVLALLLAMLLLLAACGGSASGAAQNAAASMPAAGASSPADGGDMGFLDMESAPMEPMAPQQTGNSVYQNADAKLIRRAQLHIQTERFDQAAQSLDRLVQDCGGYFENAAVYGGSYRDQNARRSGEYVVRIPADQYDRFLDQTGELGYVTSRDESSENVGEQYYDTESRLKTQRTKQERLLALLEKADTMEDIIALESALSDVEYQIEQYSSTLKRYDALIGFSTFTIYLDEVIKLDPEVGQTAGLGDRMGAGLRASLNGLVEGSQDLLVWASYHIFGLALAGGLAVVFAVLIRREVKKRRGGSEPDQDQ